MINQAWRHQGIFFFYEDLLIFYHLVMLKKSCHGSISPAENSNIDNGKIYLLI